MADVQISVVLTVYNMRECLEKCLDSLVAQTFRAFELVVVDDGSTDGSADIALSYESSFEQFAMVTQCNAGPAAARNAGMAAAHGEYILMLDSDDLFEPDLVQKMLDRALSSQADVVVCRSNEFNHVTGVWHSSKWTVRRELLPSSDVFSAEEVGGALFECFAGWPWDKLFRASFIRENDLRFPDLRNSEDLCFVYAALASAERIAVVDEVLIHHRTNRSGSVSLSQPSNPLDFYRAIVILKKQLEGHAGKDEFCSLTLDQEDVRAGFLNWAVDFALWNIECLPAGEVRRRVVELFATGGMPELEIERRGIEYYSQYPRTQKRYKLICREHEGGGVATGRSLGNIFSTAWTYVSTLDLKATVAARRG